MLLMLTLKMSEDVFKTSLGICYGASLIKCFVN